MSCQRSGTILSLSLSSALSLALSLSLAFSSSLTSLELAPAYAGPSGSSSSSAASSLPVTERVSNPATRPASAPISKDEEDHPLEVARTLNANGNYRRALVVLQANIDANNPPKGPIKISVEDWHFDNTGLNLALRELSTEQLRNLHYSEVYNLRGLTLSFLKRYADAEASLLKAVALNPQNGAALSNLSVVCLQLGRADEAIAFATKALKISDRFLDAHKNLASIYRAKNQLELERKEIEAYNRCRKLTLEDKLSRSGLSRAKYMLSLISQRPPSAKKSIALGVIYKQFNSFAEAEKCYLSGIKADGKLVEGHWAYGLLLSTQRRYGDAVKEFSEAIALDPTYGMPHFNRGNAYSHLKKYSNAIDDYTKFLEMNPRTAIVIVDAYFGRAGCYGQMKQYAAGIKDLNKALALKIAPNIRAEILSNRGSLYEALGNKTQALKDYEAAMELAPNSKVISEQRGKIMLSLGEFEQATIDLGRSNTTEVDEVSKEPPSAADLKAQIDHYDKLIKMFPNKSIDSLYNRGLLYLTMGDAIKAGADMQAVVTLSKESNATADYAACYGSIALRMQKKATDADQLLQAYSKKPRREPAPPEVQFLMNRARAITPGKLTIADAKQRTRILTLLGLDSLARNDMNSARKVLSSVRNSGDPSMDEYALAVFYLKRLGHT
ncbi:MAG: tetratricopeptide repeat protein [Candidatus Obscuribacterales bacterium]|jgi:tetratricopeptide (TPR) repeat protein